MNRRAGSPVSTARLLCALLSGVGLSAAGSVEALTVQEAILLAKPAVALVSAEVSADITMDCGHGPVTVQPTPFIETGTAWFVDGRGYLITNAHVVDPAERLPPWVVKDLREKAVEEGCVAPALRARGLAPGDRPDIEEQLRRGVSPVTITIAPNRRITVLLSNGTVLAAQVKKFSPPILLDGRGQPLPGSGRDLALLRVQDGVYPALGITSRVPNMGDPVHILGFPGVVLTNELLNQQVRLEASVTNGLVSGFKQDAIGQDVVQTDAPAAHGNSGGPAISDDATVVGVMTFVSLSPAGGSIVQGFNFLIPARDVLAFLRGTEVRPGESAFTRPWTEGLNAYFGERYPTALARFREADRLLPGLVDVRRTLLDADNKVKNPPPRPFPWAWVTASAVTVASLTAYGGMGARRWWRNRFRVLPAQVIGFMERGLEPVLLDVRNRSDYETSPLTLPGAVRLDPDRAAQASLDLQIEPAQLIVTFCTSPEERTSAAVTQALRRRGYRNVKILKGGLGGWTNARLPVEAKSHLPSIGLELYRNLTLGDIERRRFAAGTVIFNDGDDARGEAYVVHSGTVEIRKRFDGIERRLNTVREGELMGEMALFRRAPRSASAVAITDVELLVVRNERLEWLIRNRPQLTLEVLKSLSNQVVSADRERAEPARQAAS
jgi:S1-C subfamily serine protease/rhodanese-related sulfurtransferase